jgi:hypothetical protein
MTSVVLNESVNSLPFDANGNGMAQLGPLTAREVWHPDNVHINASTNVADALCSIYVGFGIYQQNFRDATFTGSTGDSSDRVNADVIKKGSFIYAVWTGGDVGAVGTMSVTGTKDV